MAALTKESAGEYVVRLAVPGFALDDLDVEVSDHVVTVRGDRTSTGRDASRLHDRLVERLELPADADTDRVTASYTADALELHAPRYSHGRSPSHKVAIRRRFALNADASGV